MIRKSWLAHFAGKSAPHRQIRPAWNQPAEHRESHGLHYEPPPSCAACDRGTRNVRSQRVLLKKCVATSSTCPSVHPCSSAVGASYDQYTNSGLPTTSPMVRLGLDGRKLDFDYQFACTIVGTVTAELVEPVPVSR